MVLHLRILLLLALATFVPTLPAQSDLKLVGHRLKTFVSTKGASELGSSVVWKVAATTFQKPPERMGAFWVFEQSGILLLVEVGLPDLEIVQRRGGNASLRGSVITIPKERRKKDGPAYGILIRSLHSSRK